MIYLILVIAFLVSGFIGFWVGYLKATKHIGKTIWAALVEMGRSEKAGHSEMAKILRDELVDFVKVCKNVTF